MKRCRLLSTLTTVVGVPKVVDITWPRNEGKEGLKVALERIAREVEDAIDAGFSIAILSDRATDQTELRFLRFLACALFTITSSVRPSVPE